ncbi:hypothetical protein ANN_15013 [Periplaneta americana]|uniref:Mos1 transposase HTH domain-containing protein n=1 Tax=Periplaneta americana TaxID=6978 RepID=A0ABQ8SZF5_PERAM|nr:hypothetical protein ANN_15013 [Periplaneta americana]
MAGLCEGGNEAPGSLKVICNVYKMIDNDGSFRQRAVIKFHVKEETFTAEIHLRLQRAYGDVCMFASSVRRWVKHFGDGNKSIQDEPRSGRPQTVSTERNKERVDEFWDAFWLNFLNLDRPYVLSAIFRLPDLEASDYHLFGSVKEQLQGQRYETLEDIPENSVFGKMKRTSTAREFSNLQNGGKNKRGKNEEKRLKAFEMWIWRRMERVKCTDRTRNEAVLERVGEERMMLKLIGKRKRNWLGHWLRRNNLLKDTLEGTVNRRRVRGRRRYQMTDDTKIYASHEDSKRSPHLWRNG